MIVDFPAPDGPTSAVTVPGRDSEAHAKQHLLARVVQENPRFRKQYALPRAPAARCDSATSSSSFSSSTSRVRSSPASASVICGPSITTWPTGATSIARNALNEKKISGRHSAGRMWRAPSFMIVPSIIPISIVAERLAGKELP